jgi:hypothetical protein
MTAAALGRGALTVARYGADPVAGSIAVVPGTYYDAALATGSSFSSVAISICGLGTAYGGIVWWTGSNWQFMS